MENNSMGNNEIIPSVEKITHDHEYVDRACLKNIIYHNPPNRWFVQGHSW